MAWSPDGTRIALDLAGDLGLEVRPWDARAERLQEPVLRQPGRFEHALLVARQPPAGCHLDSYRKWLAQVSADRLGRRERRGGGVPGRQSCVPGSDRLQPRRQRRWRRAARRRSCGCSTRRMAGSTPPCSPGTRTVSGLAFSPDGRRLYAAGWGMGGVKVFDPARDPRGRPMVSDMNQLAALTFDREGLRVLSVEWDAGQAGLRRPGRWQRADRADLPRDK